MHATADIHFRGKAVLLSGATGRIGAVLFTRLIAAGARVAVALRKPWQAQQLARRTAEAGEDPARFLFGTVAPGDAEAAAGLVKGAEDALGPIAALVSTAGVRSTTVLGADRTADAGALLAANFLSAHELARAVLAPMKRRRTGSLVFTGSRIIASPPQPGTALYRASKAALHAYADVLHRELAPHGVRVVVVAPGDVESDERLCGDGRLLTIAEVVDALLAAAAGRVAGDGPVLWL
jgi:3-oxoacyl-[acyl-carrier protein] reductase